MYIPKRFYLWFSSIKSSVSLNYFPVKFFCKKIVKKILWEKCRSIFRRSNWCPLKYVHWYQTDTPFNISFLPVGEIQNTTRQKTSSDLGHNQESGSSEVTQILSLDPDRPIKIRTHPAQGKVHWSFEYSCQIDQTVRI